MIYFNEISINYKPLLPFLSMKPITSSVDASELFRQFWSDKIAYKEEFYIMLLNQANIPIGISKISEGGLAGTVVDVKNIFQTALKANAAAIILSHNHPSGNLKPSDQDISLTNKIREGGKLMDIRILDHVILSYDGYKSFSDEGYM